MAKSGKKTEDNTPPEFENAGKHFRKFRTDKGLSTKEVSEITRISEVNLNAIENQDFEALPADTFTRGFLTIYSDFLGADTPQIVARFMEEREARRNPGKRSRLKQPKKILTPKTLAEPSHVSSMTMAGVLLVVIVVLFTGFCLYTSWNPFSFLFKETDNMQSVMQSVFPGNTSTETEEEPDISRPLFTIQEPNYTDNAETLPAVEPPSDIQQTILSETSVDDETIADRQDTSPHAATTRYIAHITFLKDSRLKVTVDGDTVTDEIFYQGDEKDWAAYNTLQLTFDEPDSAAILLNGKPVDFPELVDGLATLHAPDEPVTEP